MDRFELQRGEIDRIDYFLDQLARAVERGEVHAASYEMLAPRYLTRREELVGYITGERSHVPAAWSAAAQPPQALLAEAASARTLDQARTGGATADVAAPRWEPKPVRAPRPVPWTTILTFLGAFLVVVAIAIFSVFTWDLMSVPVKLGTMLVFTAGFFVVSELVRLKLHLRVGGIALAVVAAAMLLFDCWVVIDGYNLAGPWPWAVALLVCSLAYWGAELRLGSGIFATVGAASQAGWWWLLGAGLGWALPERMAGIAVVGALWAYVGSRFAKGPVRELAGVLAWAGPIVTSITSLALLVDVADVGSPTLLQMLSCAIAGAAALGAVEVSRRIPRVISAGSQLALLVSLGTALAEPGKPEWWVPAIALVAVVGYAAYELYRGTWAYGALALAIELLFWASLASSLGWQPWVGAALVATAAASWLGVRRIAEKTGDDALPGMAMLDGMTRVAGWVFLALAGSAALVALDEAPALMGSHTGWQQALLAAWLTGLWFAGGVLARSAIGAAGGIVGSFWLLAAVLGWAAPGLDSAWYALAMLVLAAAWLHAARPLEPALRLGASLVRTGARATAGVALVGGLGAQLALADIAAWPPVALAAVSALAWAADAAATRTPLAWAGASGSAVVASALAAYAATGRASTGAVAGAAAAAAIAVGCATVARLRARTTALWAASVAAALAGVAALVAVDARLAAVALTLLAVAWAACAVVASPLLAAAAGAMATFAALATLNHASASSWWTLAACALLGYAQLAPSFWKWEPASRADAAAKALVASGALSLAVPVLIGIAGAPFGDVARGQSWDDVSGPVFALALIALGAWLVTAAIVRREEPAWYAGLGVVVAGVLVWLGDAGVEQPEIYTTVAGAYVIAMGYLYVRLGPDRTLPALTDIVGTLVVLGPPTLQSATYLGVVLNDGSTNEAGAHALWAVALSLAFILAGVSARVRVYFFGGVLALAAVALVYSFIFLLAFWWVLLGLIGLAMLVIALTWERQRMLLADTKRVLHDRFAVWR